MDDMDDLSVTVFNDEDNEHYDCGGCEIPSSLDDDTACLIAKGLVFECDWIPGSVTLCVVREDGQGSRLIYEGL